MNELLKALEGIVQCCDGNEPAHEQIYHIAREAIKNHETEQLNILRVSGSVFMVKTIGGGHGEPSEKIVGCFDEKTDKLEKDASKNWWSIKEFEVKHYR